MQWIQRHQQDQFKVVIRASYITAVYISGGCILFGTVCSIARVRFLQSIDSLYFWTNYQLLLADCAPTLIEHSFIVIRFVVQIDNSTTLLRYPRCSSPCSPALYISITLAKFSLSRYGRGILYDYIFRQSMINSVIMDKLQTAVCCKLLPSYGSLQH